MKLAIFLCLVASVAGRPREPQQFGFGPPQQPPLIPPGFEEHLPTEAKNKLISLHFDKDLTFDERRGKIEEVFDNLPREILEKLPLPPGLERLPEEKKEKFRELHLNRGLDWRERHQLVQKAIRELPEHEQRLVEPPRPPMPPFMGQGFQSGPNGKISNGMFPPMGPPPFGPMGFPPHPPPGFELALAPTIYKQLMVVHQNPTLSVEEKKQQVDRIMSMVPQDQLDRLPLPPNFDRLDSENVQRVRQIMHNFKLDWDTRHQNVKDFISQLPVEQRRLLRPPTPPGFEQLPQEINDQIDAIFMDEKLSPPERHAKIHQIIQKLPEEIRSKLPPPPPFMTPYANQQQEQKEESINDQQ